MKVLRIISHLGVGGVQRQLLQLFPALRDSGIECSVCCIDKPGAQVETFVKAGFPVHFIKFRSRLDPIARLKLRSLVLKNGYDIVHAHMYSANMSTNASLFARGKVGVVNGYHNQLFVNNDRQQQKVVRSINGPRGVFSAPAPDGIIAVGENVRQALIEAGCDGNKITTITNGVIGPEEPIPLPDVDPGDPLRLMWAGRFVTHKRLEFMIEVARACKKAAVPIRLTLYGEGPKWYQIRKQIREYGLEESVLLPGVIANVYEGHRENEIYVSPSIREGFPNALLEACIAGRPAIVSDIEPHGEILTGKNAGHLLPSEPARWVEVFRDILANREQLKTMAENSRRTGLEHHISQTAANMKAFYEQVLTQRGQK